MDRPIGRGRQGRLERAGAAGGVLGPNFLQTAGVDDVLQARARPLAGHGFQGGVGRRHHAGERVLADDQDDAEGRCPRQGIEAWTVHGHRDRRRGFQPDQEQPLAGHGDRGPPLIRWDCNLGPPLGAGAAQGQVQIPLRRQPAGGSQGFPPGAVGADDRPIEPGEAGGLAQGVQQVGRRERGFARTQNHRRILTEHLSHRERKGPMAEPWEGEGLRRLQLTPETQRRRDAETRRRGVAARINHGTRRTPRGPRVFLHRANPPDFMRASRAFVSFLLFLVHCGGRERCAICYLSICAPAVQ